MKRRWIKKNRINRDEERRRRIGCNRKRRRERGAKRSEEERKRKEEKMRRDEWISFFFSKSRKRSHNKPTNTRTAHMNKESKHAKPKLLKVLKEGITGLAWPRKHHPRIKESIKDGSEGQRGNAQWGSNLGEWPEINVQGDKTGCCLLVEIDRGGRGEGWVEEEKGGRLNCRMWYLMILLYIYLFLFAYFLWRGNRKKVKKSKL